MSVRDLIYRKHNEAVSPGYSAEDIELLKAAGRRVAKSATTELLDWADVAGSAMAKGFDDYRHHGDTASLDEIAMAVVTLHAVVLELKARAAAELQP